MKHLHLHFALDSTLLRSIDMKLDALAATMTAIADQLTKAQTEIVSQVAALQAALADVDVPADAQAAIDSITAIAEALDALNPDA